MRPIADRALDRLLSGRTERDEQRARLLTRLAIVEAETKRLTDALAAGVAIASIAERALPRDAEAGKYTVLPTLEDFQAVITPLLFAPKADQQRIFADPQYQHLYNTVLRQLTHREHDPTWIDEVLVLRWGERSEPHTFQSWCESRDLIRAEGVGQSSKAFR